MMPAQDLVQDPCVYAVDRDKRQFRSIEPNTGPGGNDGRCVTAEDQIYARQPLEKNFQPRGGSLCWGSVPKY